MVWHAHAVCGADLLVALGVPLPTEAHAAVLQRSIIKQRCDCSSEMSWLHGWFAMSTVKVGCRNGYCMQRPHNIRTQQLGQNFGCLPGEQGVLEFKR